MNRAVRARTAFLVGVFLIYACQVRGQDAPLHDSSFEQKPLAPLSSNGPVVRDGLFSISVSVTDTAGNPVPDLEPWDFTLLDNGQPVKIRTLHNSQAASEPPSELIFVLDTVNLSPEQLTQTESAIAHFLLRNNGQLQFPCLLYRLTRNGLFSSLRPVTDGRLLVEELKQKRDQWPVSAADQDIKVRDIWDPGQPGNRLSLHALGAIAIHQRDIPARKVVVWIGPGWPVNVGETSFNEATELSTRLREARITLDNVNVWLDLSPSSDNHFYIDAPRSQKEMEPGKLALQALAIRTGGMVLDSSGDLDRDIQRCAEEVRNFYSITFNPPRTTEMDEYHDLRVQVTRPGTTARAPTGYYNEPVYFDSPRAEIEKITVAQLEQLVHSRTDLRRRLANLELTERLSTPRLDALLKEVHGERERQALTADADLSIALTPPPEDVVRRPPPPLEEQRAILRRAFDYLQNVIPKLPDFYALRTTARFEEPAEHNNESWKMQHQDQTLHFAAGEHATVLYRNGNEVVEKKQKLGKHPVIHGARARGLQTRGTFGPILTFLLTAAASGSSTFAWNGWERGKEENLAVFTFRASGTHNVPELTYCCLPEGNGTTPYHSRPDDKVEFAVNPDTGAIMRITIDADLDEQRDPDVPLIRSQIMVEYGREEVGDKNYICPQRSVEVSRARSERQIQEWGMVFSVYSYFETMINDASFGGYHKFGSEFRILPGFEENQEPQTPAPQKRAH